MISVMEILKMKNKTDEELDDIKYLLLNAGNSEEEVEQLLLLIPPDKIRAAIKGDYVVDLYLKTLIKYRLADDLATNAQGATQQRYNMLKTILADTDKDSSIEEQIEEALRDE